MAMEEEKDEGGPLPDGLRCRKTDGKEWRCSKRRMDGKCVCLLHYNQRKYHAKKQRIRWAERAKRPPFPSSSSSSEEEEGCFPRRGREAAVRALECVADKDEKAETVKTKSKRAVEEEDANSGGDKEGDMERVTEMKKKRVAKEDADGWGDLEREREDMRIKRTKKGHPKEGRFPRSGSKAVVGTLKAIGVEDNGKEGILEMNRKTEQAVDEDGNGEVDKEGGIEGATEMENQHVVEEDAYGWGDVQREREEMRKVKEKSGGKRLKKGLSVVKNAKRLIDGFMVLGKSSAHANNHPQPIKEREEMEGSSNLLSNETLGDGFLISQQVVEEDANGEGNREREIEVATEANKERVMKEDADKWGNVEREREEIRKVKKNSGRKSLKTMLSEEKRKKQNLNVLKKDLGGVKNPEGVKNGFLILGETVEHVNKHPRPIKEWKEEGSLNLLSDKKQEDGFLNSQLEVELIDGLDCLLNSQMEVEGYKNENHEEGDNTKRTISWNVKPSEIVSRCTSGDTASNGDQTFVGHRSSLLVSNGEVSRLYDDQIIDTLENKKAVVDNAQGEGDKEGEREEVTETKKKWIVEDANQWGDVEKEKDIKKVKTNSSRKTSKMILLSDKKGKKEIKNCSKKRLDDMKIAKDLQKDGSMVLGETGAHANKHSRSRKERKEKEGSSNMLSSKKLGDGFSNSQLDVELVDGLKNSQLEVELEGDFLISQMEAKGEKGENLKERRKGKGKISWNVKPSKIVSSCTSVEKVSNRGQNTTFFDFEGRRSSQPVRKGEVWAMYDEHGMPRCYAKIIENGFCHSTRIRFLRYNNTDMRKWYTESGALRPCGTFIPCSLASSWALRFNPTAFSHKLPGWGEEDIWTYDIYPRKGDIWAITTGTNCTPFHMGSPTIQKYHIVEIFEDYNSQTGTKVGYLVKVKGGYRSLFQRYVNEGNEVCFCIPPTKLDWFSHQVPSFWIKGEKMYGDCLELDPASVPLYIEDFTDNLELEINENYLCLGFLDLKISWRQVEFRHDTLWAAYDDQTGMPQKYIVIRYFYKSNPESRIEMTMLKPCPNTEDERRWSEAGLPIACGYFERNKTVDADEHLVFSHQVPLESELSTEPGKYGLHIYKIYPRKGDVWGIYKNWDVGRSCNLSRLRGKLKYEIVEISGDYNNEKGIKVISLVRVEGFKSIFRREKTVFVIPGNELYRFAHQIPAYKFEAKQGDGLLKGSLILDPLLVPETERNYFTFRDPSILEILKVHPLCMALQYLTGKEKKYLENHEVTCRQSEHISIKLLESSEEQEGFSMDKEKILNAEANDYLDNATLRNQSHEGQRTGGEAVKQVENITSGEDDDICEINSWKAGEKSKSEIEGIDKKVKDVLNREFGGMSMPSIAELHDCGHLKLPKDFELNQIWALYDDLDGKPRCYARIEKFTHKKIMVKLLGVHPTSKEEMQWADKDLPVACGMFRASKLTVLQEISAFSYQVFCGEGKRMRSYYKIFPRQGEVWAIYQDWDINWTLSDLKNHLQYKLVEILSDFSEAGISVACLVRIEGRRDVFRRRLHDGFGLFQQLTRKDMLCFSHRVPAEGLEGDEIDGILKGSWRVDPNHVSQTSN